MSVSLANDDAFLLPGKTSLVWGQLVVSAEYVSGTGFVVNSASGDPDRISIDFYGIDGKFHETGFDLVPGTAHCVSGDDLLKILQSGGRTFDGTTPVWYFARSKRPDLSAFSAHSNRLTGHSSGEHNF